MKLKFNLLLLLVAITISMVACRKGHENKSVTLNVNLTRGTQYQLDVSKYGDADDIASIVTQATDYTTSEISRDAVTAKYIYTYATAASPKISSTGHDAVVLKVTEPAGRRHCDDETSITINFTLQ